MEKSKKRIVFGVGCLNVVIVNIILQNNNLILAVVCVKNGKLLVHSKNDLMKIIIL